MYALGQTVTDRPPVCTEVQLDGTDFGRFGRVFGRLNAVNLHTEKVVDAFGLDFRTARAIGIAKGFKRDSGERVVLLLVDVTMGIVTRSVVRGIEECLEDAVVHAFVHIQDEGIYEAVLPSSLRNMHTLDFGFCIFNVRFKLEV